MADVSTSGFGRCVDGASVPWPAGGRRGDREDRAHNRFSVSRPDRGAGAGLVN